ncbi:MAG: single-stranded-DNA-specific exonuclease RecJ [Bacteroidales bacterium]|nr:single-stranded-DNA-specific exonuclease RecJ [Bacteroidales bacterium]MDZ4203480.1 single-stranded-DNA-specific exonuclease RecJ [Bacteroidales bacterium]
MEKRWVVKPPGDQQLVDALMDELKISEGLAHLLAQRDITSYKEAKAFFRPQFAALHDPFLMKDMDKAVKRIGRALEKQEKIMIYGDYDVDGTTAVSLLYTFIKSSYDNIDFYIPDRYDEGYGISVKGIEYARDQGFTLIIALDCGIKAVEKVAYATTVGIDFIICDHHRPGDELPAAVAVLDPKRNDCPYPYKELSGCGIGFKLVQALASEWKGDQTEHLISYLDLVVVSIAADIVPITGENRIMAYYGLNLLNESPRPGIQAILEVSGIIKKDKEDLGNDLFFTRELTISDLVFQVGPRINAAGRMENGRESVALLVSNNLDEALKMAEQINQYNTSRRNLDMLTTQEALEKISNNVLLLKNKSTVVYQPEWHKGVIGIVASRLTETFYRPTIVFTRSNNLITGSARSIKDFDVYDAIDACNDLLEHFGGHKYAAGLSLKPENLDEFCRRFEEVVANNITDFMLIPEVEIDMKLELHQINSKFYRILKQFSPFGPGNLSPVFQTNGVVDTGRARIVGKNHLKFEVVHPSTRGFPFPAIAFQQGEHFDLVASGKPVNICYHVEENHWNGNISLQLNIKDIRPAG